MQRIQYTKSPGVPHGAFSEEFLCHREGSEWWYCTGYLNDEEGRMYSFQFTLVRPRIAGVLPNILMTALTDFAMGRHYYAQRMMLTGKRVSIMDGRISVEGLATLAFTQGAAALSVTTNGYALALDMLPAKQPVWHCGGGVLKMGIGMPGQTTYYWSYTNLAVSGRLTLGGKETAVSGKAWFDKQGGSYNLVSRWTHWEWFSLRFFDNEEAMLFSFPQDGYRDGTFIDAAGGARRLTDYEVTPLGFTQAGGYRFSFGWKVSLRGVKDEEYTIKPKMDGQLNLAYFELLADIVDRRGKVAGYCFVELLPGVYNKRIHPLALVKRVK